MVIEKNMKIIELIDTYEKLLTPKQAKMIKSYYFDNLSLSEIGDNFDITRQAVSDSLGKSLKQLNHFEDKLLIVAKKHEMLDRLNRSLSSDNLTKEILEIIDIIRS